MTMWLPGNSTLDSSLQLSLGPVEDSQQCGRHLETQIWRHVRHTLMTASNASQVMSNLKWPKSLKHKQEVLHAGKLLDGAAFRALMLLTARCKAPISACSQKHECFSKTIWVRGKNSREAEAQIRIHALQIGRAGNVLRAKCCGFGWHNWWKLQRARTILKEAFLCVMGEDAKMTSATSSTSTISKS